MLQQQILNGLVMGGVYALFALGFTLIFGIHRIMNLSHGAVMMVGAFVALIGVQEGLPFWAAMVLAMVAGGLLSVSVEFLAFRPLRSLSLADAEFGSMISSLGMALFIMSIAQRLSKTEVMRFPFGTVPVSSVEILGLRVTSIQLVILGSAIVLVAGLAYYLYRTASGRQIRAVAGNQKTAQLLGVNPSVIFFQTFFISGALAGAAGVLVGLAFNSIHYLMGEPYLLRGFVAIVLGGMGSVPGALAGGLVLGLMQALSAAYLPGLITDAVIFALLFVILLVRPAGLFGLTPPEGVTRRV
jgi:branched-chain amino acid transport system permease protein